jgi:hypothetical protein
MPSSSSSSWRNSPAFYRARYASLGSTQPLLPPPTTTQATRRDGSNVVASFLSSYPTILRASSKLRVRTLLAALCGLLLAGYTLSATASKRASRRTNRILSRGQTRRPLLLLRPMIHGVTSEGAQLAPPTLRRHPSSLVYGPRPVDAGRLRHPNPDAVPRTASSNRREARVRMIVPDGTGHAALASPTSSVRPTVVSPRRRTVVSVEPPLALRRLALVHGWATSAILGGCFSLAAVSVLCAIRRRRTTRGPDDRRRRRSATGDGDDDDDDDASECSDDSEYDTKEAADGSMDDELYRVLHSSDPVAIGYGSFPWSPASTIISVEPASSSWTGDYFDKFDV